MPYLLYLIVAFYNGERISIQKSKELLKKSGDDILIDKDILSEKNLVAERPYSNQKKQNTPSAQTRATHSCCRLPRDPSSFGMVPAIEV